MHIIRRYVDSRILMYASYHRALPDAQLHLSTKLITKVFVIGEIYDKQGKELASANDWASEEV